MAIASSDLILVTNTSGTESRKVQVQNLFSAASGWYVLVNEGTTSYRCLVSDLQDKATDSRYLLLNRGANSYKVKSTAIVNSAGVPTTDWGEEVLLSNGNWTVPANVYSICLLMIGAGGSASNSSKASEKGAGGGGGMVWANNIPVVPGEIWKVTVATGPSSSQNSGNCQFYNKNAGTKGGNFTASGGRRQSQANAGAGIGNITNLALVNGTYYMGAGGPYGSYPSTSGNYNGGGGGPGYSGPGGQGGKGASRTEADETGSPGQGGGGGGGGGWFSGGGGGTGMYGEGASGAGGGTDRTNDAEAGGYGGSGGQRGAPYQSVYAGPGQSSTGGGAYGGGAGQSSGTPAALTGGPGVVRVIWGSDRWFPSHNVGPTPGYTPPNGAWTGTP